LKENKLKKFLLINLGVIILVFGLYFFLIPADLATGGVTGLGMVINHIFPNMPVGLLMAILNLALFVLAFIFIGHEFGGYTIYSSLLISGLIYLLELFVPLKGPLVDDLMINLIYGILIQGIGLAIVLNAGTSTGGTDIIAKIINKYTHLEIGKSLFLADFLIIILAILVYGVELGLYALLGVMINSAVIDKIIAGFNTKIKMVIISHREEDITKFIIEELDRGVTLLHGEGGFSHTDKRIINTVVSRREYIRIKNYVKEVDHLAFVWVNFVNEVFGEGFTH